MKNTSDDASPRATCNVVRLAHDPFVPPMEKAVYLWMQDCYPKDLSVTTFNIMLTARTMYQK